MISTFPDRKAKGTALENKVDDYLSQNDVHFIRTGYEQRYTDDEIKLLIKDTEAIPLRMTPDRYLPRFKKYLEIINSKAIERIKYNFLLNNHNQCYIVNQDDYGNLFCARIIDIEFRIPVKRIWSLPFDIPIEDDYWRTPKLLPKHQFDLFIQEAIKRGTPTTGEAFAFIKWEAINGIPLHQLIHG